MKAHLWTRLFALAVRLDLPEPVIAWIERRAAVAIGMRSEMPVDDIEQLVERFEMPSGEGNGAVHPSPSIRVSENGCVASGNDAAGLRPAIAPADLSTYGQPRTRAEGVAACGTASGHPGDSSASPGHRVSEVA
jgi:hypothetical protein